MAESNTEYANVKWLVHSVKLSALGYPSFNTLELYYGFVFMVWLPNSSRRASVDSKHF